MELYSFCFSSTSYRVRIALALKGLDYQYRSINLRKGEQKSDSYRELNPAKGVPLLVTDSGEHISQSMAILNYLEEAYPEPALLPKELMLKTRILSVCNNIASDIHPVNNLRILGYLTNQLGVSEDQKNDWYKHWIKEGMSAVEAQLVANRSGHYCFGDEVTLADVCLIPQVGNALRFGCDMSEYPRSMEIYERCIELPAFVAAAPTNQPDFANL